MSGALTRASFHVCNGTPVARVERSETREAKPKNPGFRKSSIRATILLLWCAQVVVGLLHGELAQNLLAGR
jgi:hypothetical protein